MPCFDPTTSIIHEDNKRNLHIRTRMLCAVCRQLELELGVNDTKHLLIDAAIVADGLDPTEIANWWQKHKEADNERS